jgi:hypothetical protein
MTDFLRAPMSAVTAEIDARADRLGILQDRIIQTVDVMCNLQKEASAAIDAVDAFFATNKWIDASLIHHNLMKTALIAMTDDFKERRKALSTLLYDFTADGEGNTNALALCLRVHRYFDSMESKSQSLLAEIHKYMAFIAEVKTIKAGIDVL